MRLHKEGTATILVIGIPWALAIAAAIMLGNPLLWGLAAVLLILLVLVLQFFRNPVRVVPKEQGDTIYAPADGRIVVTEVIQDSEHFGDRRLQISIFMSPFNVHANRIPVDGEVEHVEYYPGKYLVASHPKASELNERCSTVINAGDYKVLVRQIAGLVARRLVCYMKPGLVVRKGDELGFIKFGSRCDILLPENSESLVAIGDVVKGNLTPIARTP